MCVTSHNSIAFTYRDQRNQCSTPVFEGPDVTVVSNRPEGRRKRKRSIKQPNQSTSVSDVFPLQREVLLKQMEVFSAQLQLTEEQREYYGHKKQRLLEKDQLQL